jgi:hypothetical protein
VAQEIKNYLIPICINKISTKQEILQSDLDKIPNSDRMLLQFLINLNERIKYVYKLIGKE